MDVKNPRAVFAGDDLVAAFDFELHLRAQRHETRRARAVDDFRDGDAVLAALGEAVVNRREVFRQRDEYFLPLGAFGLEFLACLGDLLVESADRAFALRLERVDFLGAFFQNLFDFFDRRDFF